MYPVIAQGHGNSQASPSTAPNASAAAQPVEFASWTGGAGHEPTFHFKNQGAPSTPIEVVELEQLDNWPVLPGHPGELAAIPQVGPAAMEETRPVTSITASTIQRHICRTNCLFEKSCSRCTPGSFEGAASPEREYADAEVHQAGHQRFDRR